MSIWGIGMGGGRRCDGMELYRTKLGKEHRFKNLSLMHSEVMSIVCGRHKARVAENYACKNKCIIPSTIEKTLLKPQPGLGMLILDRET